EALLRRVINANLRVGDPENLQRVVQYAQNTANPAAMRAEAVEALRTWAKPSVLDRVDGRYRGEIIRNEAELKSRTAGDFIDLLTDHELAVRQHAAEAIGKLGIQQGAAALLAAVKNDNEAAMQVESLKALVALEDPLQEEAIRVALEAPEKAVRVAGLDL